MELTTIDTDTTPEISKAQEALTVAGPESAHPVAVKSHRIDLEPAYRTDARGRGTGHGKAFMVYEGEVIGESKEPAFDAARWLLKRGLALPNDPLTTYRNGTPCVFTIVGRAAKLSVRDNPRGGLTLCAFREPSPETLKALRETKAATV